MDNKTKYGDDSLFESFTDNNIFFPLGDLLMPALYKIGLTANQITILSTLSTFTSCYFLFKNDIKKFSIFYLLGYLLDCIDGRFARKYKMSSNLGMTMDGVSDIISNIAVALIFISKNRLKKNFLLGLLLLIFISYKTSVSYSLNEAIACYKKNKHDNFYEYKKKLLENNANKYEKLLADIYILIHKYGYKAYRNNYKTYKEDEIYKRLENNREFGPGNFAIFIIIMFYYFSTV